MYKHLCNILLNVSMLFLGISLLFIDKSYPLFIPIFVITVLLYFYFPCVSPPLKIHIKIINSTYKQ